MLRFGGWLPVPATLETFIGGIVWAALTTLSRWRRADRSPHSHWRDDVPVLRNDQIIAGPRRFRAAAAVTNKPSRVEPSVYFRKNLSNAISWRQTTSLTLDFSLDAKRLMGHQNPLTAPIAAFRQAAKSPMGGSRRVRGRLRPVFLQRSRSVRSLCQSSSLPMSCICSG